MTTDLHLDGDPPRRLRSLVSVVWDLFSRKVGGEVIPISREASMQLQYAFLLCQLLDSIRFHADEHYSVELESSIPLEMGRKDVDVLAICNWSGVEYTIAIEMKCYRTRTYSGGLRGAQDIFMKDVYQDLDLLERYCENGSVQAGVALVMTDYKNFVSPKLKEGKAWEYDISDGKKTDKNLFTTPIGGKEVRIELEKEYHFSWRNFGDFYFTELEGQSR